MELIYYIRLFKFRYHVSFIVVILGALIFSHQPIFALIKPLVLYISFNFLLYGGLYTLNDIADIESDRSHPQKKNRPLPSKKISIFKAYILTFTCILSALLISYFYFGRRIFLMYLFFILVNQIYTHIAKKIPYLEILFNSLTYPMRFFLGILLVSYEMPYFLLEAILLFAFGIASVRRMVEKKAQGWEAREVLKYYTVVKLIILQIIAFSLIILISIISYPSYSIWYTVIIISYLVFVFGIYFSNYFINFYQWLFLN